MSNFRKTYIIDLMSRMVRENPDLEIMDIIRATLRSRNFKNPSGATHLLASDEELSNALEITEQDLKNERD
tara:strand:+ start:443 stop:655 length:213 start_codon:yes stop_codon:yes gene_type:complete